MTPQRLASSVIKQRMRYYTSDNFILKLAKAYSVLDKVKTPSSFVLDLDLDQQYRTVFYTIVGALEIQLATPQIVRWLQLVVHQLEDDDLGYDSDKDEVATALTASPSLPIPTGVFSISAFNEHIQRERHTVTYATQSSGPAHMLTWISECTVNGSTIGHGTAYKKATSEAAAAQDVASKLFWMWLFI
jgi:hypothetical protein